MWFDDDMELEEIVIVEGNDLDSVMNSLVEKISEKYDIISFKWYTASEMPAFLANAMKLFDTDSAFYNLRLFRFMRDIKKRLSE